MGPQIKEGMVRFEKYLRRKGWFGFEKGSSLREVEGGAGGEGAGPSSEIRAGNEEGYRIVAEIALAYAITKVLLPVRILVSLWATPWCARGIARMRGAFSSLRK